VLFLSLSLFLHFDFLNPVFIQLGQADGFFVVDFLNKGFIIELT